MPQDPHLYGQPPPKKQKKEISVSSSLTFASQLSSLVAAQKTTVTTSGSSASAATAATTGRTRPSRSSKNELSGVKLKKKGTSSKLDGDDNNSSDGGSKLRLKSPVGTEDGKAERAHARRRMEAKARLYAAMQRGDYVGREVGLVDFDRKWAEQQDSRSGNPDSSSDYSSSDDEEDNIDKEIIEYEDEFGRLRRGTRAEKLRMERRLARGEASAAELDRMSARPKAPENLIVGDAVQVEAFNPQNAEAMEELARKRDRSATPPPAVHYEADKEIRTKGVGFYAFSKDEEKRKAEMENLEKERERTEKLRKEREEKVAARKREIEQRRRELGERRAKKMADNFLEGLGKDIFPSSSGGGGDEATQKE